MMTTSNFPAALSSAARARIAMTALVLAVVAVPSLASAQGQLNAHRTYATRSDLESAASAAEQLARRSPDKRERERKQREASVIRERLRDGDFQPGHRIALSVQTDSAVADTLTVRADRSVMLPGLPEMSLVGVLDSELQSYLQKEISRYIKSPTVRATGLLRLQISGAVGRAGFYSLPMDSPVTDAIMLAGGPTINADLRKVKVHRGDDDVLNENMMNEAIRAGLTVSEIGLRPGDDLQVGDKTTAGWATAGNILRGSAALVFPLFWIFRRF